MNSVIVFFVALALASAAPQSGTRNSRASAGPVVSVRSQTDDINPDGSYSYGLELDDGTSIQESGSVKNPSPEGGELVSVGSFSYVAPDGQKITLNYVADGEGFKPDGAHLPVAPAIPEGIRRALAYIASQPPQKQ